MRRVHRGVSIQHPRGAAALAACLALLAVFLQGCAGQNKADDRPIVHSEPPPTAQQVCELYNPSVAALDRLWARTELRIQGVDRDGNDIDETAEGYLQFIRPGQVFLSVKKVGETYFCLGSNASTYWWMDLRKPRTALMGSIEKATPAAAAKFGVPVHPLDLIDLLGVLPLDPKDATTAWSDDGEFVVMTMRGRWGDKELYFASDLSRLSAVRLLDAAGEVACESTIEASEAVKFREDPSRRAQAPVRITLLIPAAQMQVTVRLHDPENQGAAMKEASFNPQTLLRAYNIEAGNVRSVDGPAPSPAAVPATSSTPSPAPAAAEGPGSS